MFPCYDISLSDKYLFSISVGDLPHSGLVAVAPGKEMEGKKVSLHQVGEWTCNIGGYALIWFFCEK